MNSNEIKMTPKLRGYSVVIKDRIEVKEIRL